MLAGFQPSVVHQPRKFLAKSPNTRQDPRNTQPLALQWMEVIVPVDGHVRHALKPSSWHLGGDRHSKSSKYLVSRGLEALKAEPQEMFGCIPLQKVFGCIGIATSFTENISFSMTTLESPFRKVYAAGSCPFPLENSGFHEG